jgi:hypothetical protein
MVRQKVTAAKTISQHIFDILGTSPRHWGNPIDWHQDVKSGHRWPMRFYTNHGADLTPGKGIDVKIPWELSRSHHLVVLAQAWRLTGEERFAAECFTQWESWLGANPWGDGVHWASTMEVGIRAVNWLWAFGLLTDAPGWTSERQRALAESVWQHATHIEYNLEVGVRNGKIIAANHYLANVCGLACLGLLCPKLPGADRWQRVGLRALEQEIRRQVLPDGFFFESSTSYHRLAIELFLVPALLARRSGHEMSEDYWARLERMLEVILYLTRPDGCVPQIGDNDDGRLLILSGYPDWSRHDHRYLLALGAVLFQRGDFKAASLLSPKRRGKVEAEGCLEEVFWLLGQEGVEMFENLPYDSSVLESRAFPDSGLYVIRSQEGQDYALIRTGVSIPYAPTAHAHNDALSLELWLDGLPIFVDPGTYCYTSDLIERNRLRSTTMHNTVMVGGQEINRIPPGETFRLERDAQVQVLEWCVEGEEVRLVVERTTTMQGSSCMKHTRTVVYSRKTPSCFQIEDGIDPADRSCLYWQLVPGCITPRIKRDDGEVLCEGESYYIKMSSDALLDISLLRVSFAPAFGCKADGLTLRVALGNTSRAHVRTYIQQTKEQRCGISVM